MTIELSMNCGGKRLKADRLENLIRVAKDLDGLKLSRDDRILVIGKGAIFHAYGIAKQDMEKIESETNAVRLEISLNRRIDEKPSKKDAQLDISWETKIDRDAFPQRILGAFRTDPDHAKCGICGRWTQIGMGVKFCPHCQNPLDVKSWDRKLGCCAGCPEDPEGGSVYHHSYDYCPKCSRLLKRINYHWFDFCVPEEHFLGNGIPLSELDIGSDLMVPDE